MRSPVHALSLLALGLGLAGLHGDALAAPSTPPPPRASSITPPPPSSTTPSTPSGSSASAKPATSPSPTPPPPTAPTANAPGQPGGGEEPAAPPQDLSRTWGYSKTQPLEPRYVKTPEPTVAAPNPAGFYSGVSVQGNHVPPFPAPHTGTPPVVLTWTGFERAPEGSRVFFELSAAAAHEVTSHGLTLRIRLRNTKVNVRNNTRYLDLRYFETPVRTVKVTRKGRDTLATIVLKRDAMHAVDVIDGKAGYKLLVVQFGDARPSAAEAAGAP